MTSLKLLFIQHVNEWLSYEDIQQVEKASRSEIRAMISELRDKENMTIVSKMKKGFKFIDLEQDIDKDEIKLVFAFAKKRLCEAKKALRIYNKWLDMCCEHVQDYYQDSFMEMLEATKEASGYRGDIEELIDTKEDLRTNVEEWLG